MRTGDKSMGVKTSTFPLLQNHPWDDVVVLFGHELVVGSVLLGCTSPC